MGAMMGGGYGLQTPVVIGALPQLGYKGSACPNGAGAAGCRLASPGSAEQPYRVGVGHGSLRAASV
jgi:hypothetical protein